MTEAYHAEQCRCQQVAIDIHDVPELGHNLAELSGIFVLLPLCRSPQ